MFDQGIVDSDEDDPSDDLVLLEGDQDEELSDVEYPKHIID